MKILSIIYRLLRKTRGHVFALFYTPIAKFLFAVNEAKVGTGLRIRGFLRVVVTRQGKLTIGSGCRFNSGPLFNVSGGNQRMTFWVDGILTIGNNVGMSSSSILCKHNIEIGNNVIIGGGTLIIDSDSHAISAEHRTSRETDRNAAKSGKVTIRNGAFVGARSTILKGVTIGENSIIGACSVVTKDVPASEIWAGNPARFIKKL